MATTKTTKRKRQKIPRVTTDNISAQYQDYLLLHNDTKKWFKAQRGKLHSKDDLDRRIAQVESSEYLEKRRKKSIIATLIKMRGEQLEKELEKHKDNNPKIYNYKRSTKNPKWLEVEFHNQKASLRVLKVLFNRDRWLEERKDYYSKHTEEDGETMEVLLHINEQYGIDPIKTGKHVWPYSLFFGTRAEYEWLAHEAKCSLHTVKKAMQEARRKGIVKLVDDKSSPKRQTIWSDGYFIRYWDEIKGAWTIRKVRFKPGIT